MIHAQNQTLNADVSLYFDNKKYQVGRTTWFDLLGNNAHVPTIEKKFSNRLKISVKASSPIQRIKRQKRVEEGKKGNKIKKIEKKRRKRKRGKKEKKEKKGQWFPFESGQLAIRLNNLYRGVHSRGRGW